MHRPAKLRHANPAPISGLDALLANQVFFYDDPERFTDSVNKLCDELEQHIEKKNGVTPDTTPRIVISGCPMAVPNWKLPSIIESAGAVVVGEESCIGERGTQNLVSTGGESVDALIENLVDRYFTIDCAVFTPPRKSCHAPFSTQRSLCVLAGLDPAVVGEVILQHDCNLAGEVLIHNQHRYLEIQSH